MECKYLDTSIISILEYSLVQNLPYLQSYPSLGHLKRRLEKDIRIRFDLPKRFWGSIIFKDFKNNNNLQSMTLMSFNNLPRALSIAFNPASNFLCFE